MCLLLILSNKLDLNQETRFTILCIKLFMAVINMAYLYAIGTPVQFKKAKTGAYPW